MQLQTPTLGLDPTLETVPDSLVERFGRRWNSFRRSKYRADIEDKTPKLIGEKAGVLSSRLKHEPRLLTLLASWRGANFDSIAVFTDPNPLYPFQ